MMPWPMDENGRQIAMKGPLSCDEPDSGLVVMKGDPVVGLKD